MFKQRGDVCHLCGHSGATVADHLLPFRDRPDLAADPSNMRPAHGTDRQRGPGNVSYDARCQVCLAAGKTGTCNGSRGAKSLEAANPTEPYVPPVVLGGRWQQGQPYTPPVLL